ncbi:MAG: prepilin-type N-terminal cleavage/methylation domain-containing protein [Dokdonella sp.]|uniref:type IV pilin protein n=1 Tax=Dokdonella sp. TaxID=2291710 RepID=UPI003263A280
MHTPRTRVRRKSGFTLLELMLTIALIGVIVAIALPAYRNQVTKSRNAQAIADMLMIMHAIERYSSDNRTLPSSLSDTSAALPADPWGRPYVYYNIVQNGRGHARKDHALNPINTDYDLYTKGPDGRSKPQVTQKDSLDDVIRAYSGTYLGVAADF